jgi:hypothetical protein
MLWVDRVEQVNTLSYGSYGYRNLSLKTPYLYRKKSTKSTRSTPEVQGGFCGHPLR